MLVTTVEYDNYVGRVVTGKIYSGSTKVTRFNVTFVVHKGQKHI